MNSSGRSLASLGEEHAACHLDALEPHEDRA
jgi:hypothetical protein